MHRLFILVYTYLEFKPGVLYYGNGGFHGYLVFVFKRKGLVLMENMIYGNATYIFRDNWEELSKKSKAEIVKDGLQEHRFVHRRNWSNLIKKLLK